MSNPPSPPTERGTPAKLRRSRLRSWSFRIVRLAVISYVTVLVFLFFGQGWLIFPGRASQGQSYALVKTPANAELLHLKTPSGDDVVALFGLALQADGSPRTDTPSRPTILFFYGNADCLAHNTSLFNGLRRTGANVLIPEYVGFGMSTGSPSEASCIETGEAAFDYLSSRPDLDAARIVCAGWSLGSGVAADVASRRPCAGVALFSSFTSMVEMGHKLYPYVPVSLLLRHRFPTIDTLAHLQCPVFIAHGRLDEEVPFTMAERNAAASAVGATLVPVEGAGHNNLFGVGGKPLFDALTVFIARIGADRPVDAAAANATGSPRAQ